MSSRPTGEGSSALAWAREAHALVQARPRAALALAERALATASAEHDVEAEVAARHALYWAQDVLGDARTARKTLKAGIRLATQHGDARGAAILRRNLAFSLCTAGQARAAKREIDSAIAVLTGRDWAESQVHRVEIHRRAHRSDPETHRLVCADASRALRLLRREGNEIWEARLLFNRGLLYRDRGELAKAAADLNAAHVRYLRNGAEAAALNAAVVLAGLALLHGDVLACLTGLQAAEAALASAGLSYNQTLSLEQIRVIALTQARLLGEAHAAATRNIDICARAGHDYYVAAGLLDLAAIATLARDPAGAQHYATKAMRSFAARGQPVRAALARGVALRALVLAGRVRRSSLRAAVDAVAVLERAGWRRDALRTRVVIAKAALAIGDSGAAREQLNLARPLWRSGTATDRIELCQARGLLQLADGDQAAAERLFERGVRIVDDYRAALGAVELRATASGIGAELGVEGLRIAVASGRPEKVLVWCERLRASALRLPAVRPPRDARLGKLQVELRRAIEEGAAGRQTRLEEAIRERSWIVDGAGGARADLLDLSAATRAVDGRAVVEYLELDDSVHAVTLVAGRLSFHGLAGAGATDELGWLRFAHARLAAGRMTPVQRATIRANARASAEALEDILLGPLLPAIGDLPLLIVPTGGLHAVPWAALPSLRGRPLVVAPSLTTWTRIAARRHSRQGHAVFVAGPRLRHAGAEVRELGALLPGSTVLDGREATAAATLAALDGAALAHLACHGHFRADSPLFSSLELADGRLNVYELQQLKRAPEIVVLSACDVALSSVHPGDELLGLSAALLGMGTRTVVASVVPVPDAAARRMMLAFHRELAAGAGPATALARAQARATVPGFVCLGNG
jgi:CHAT domain-containing protein